MNSRLEAPAGNPRLPSRHAPGAGDVPVLVLPGLGGSGPLHWQSRWEARDPGLRRVEQASWDRPRLPEWTATLERAVRSHRRVVLVAHSLGCALVAHWARGGATDRVASALLVAPPDVDRLDHLPELASFAPVPLARLPFPAWVVASTNDPYASIDRARHLAQAWGARFLGAGAAGHLNVESGHGDWAEGERLLGELRRAAREEAAP